MNPKFKIKRTDFRALKRLQKKSPEIFEHAMEKGALQLLNWMNNGSEKESRKPPIRTGVLRGSGTAFVGSKLVGQTPNTGDGTPLLSYNGKPLVITIIYNTDYATKMHEWKGGWGTYTKQDGDAGNKWIEKHLQADKNDLTKMIAIEFKKELNSDV